jgi:hypothetical protein
MGMITSVFFSSLSRSQKIAWVICSTLFGFLCIFPAVAVRLDHAFGFQGIEMQGSDAEFHYAARVREIHDGFSKASNVYYAGDKSQPYLQPPLPEWVIAQLGSLFGLDAARSMILGQWLFGMAVFAVMVGCFYEITRRYWWSLIGVAVFLCAGFLSFGPFFLTSLFNGTAGHLEFLTFARPINPQWSATLFFGGLWLTSVWMRSRSRYALLGVGLLTVAAFYSYIYVWTLLGAIYVFFRDLLFCSARMDSCC